VAVARGGRGDAHLAGAHVAQRLATHVGLDLDGNEIVLEGDDLLARMVQHEIDHLDGVLLLDRLDTDTRKEAMRELRQRELDGTLGAGTSGDGSSRL
jgi:peptide deformylase